MTPRRKPSGDTGLTLVELLVTMVLFGIVGTIVTSVFFAASESTQRSTYRQDNTRLAQIAMENLTKSVRAGSQIEQLGDAASPAFTVATPERLGLYAFVGDRPVQLTYTVDGTGRLVETRRPADASSSAPYWTFTGTPSTRVVIDRVVNSATEPLFTYYNGDGAGVAFDPVPGDIGSMNAIRSVDITLEVQTRDDDRVPSAFVEQRVHLPNLGSIG